MSFVASPLIPVLRTLPPFEKVTVFNEMVHSYGSYVKFSDPGVLETKQTELSIGYHLLEPEDGQEGNSYEITGIT